MIERGKKMGKTNDGIGNGYGKLQGADAPAQLAFSVAADEVEAGTSLGLMSFESHAEALGHSVIGISYVGHDTPYDPTELAVEGTLAQMGAFLDAFTADEEAFADAVGEGDFFLYCGPEPNEDVPGVSDSAKPIEYENAALDAIRERHHWENGGSLIGILPYRGP
jgi:hypothetical protein